MTPDRPPPDCSHATGRLVLAPPPGVVLGPDSRIVGDAVTRNGMFSRLRSRQSPAVSVGARSLIDGVAFNLDEHAVVTIGDDCELVECFLIAAERIHIGHRVTIGWHATIVDSDFHPVAPAERMQDVRALSPLGRKTDRRLGISKAIEIGDDVWIGPVAIILKGVRIGAGARIEPGAVITRDVEAGARMLGNPAAIVPRET